MLILLIILGWSTRQVDYTTAFVHAPIDHDPEWDNMTKEQQQQSGIYIKMPHGFSQQGKVLKLKRSLYGLKRSPRNFFQHLKSKLEGVGFKSNESVDPCLFISEKVICLIYVDDTLLFSPKEEYIDEVIEKLSKSELEFEVKDSVAGFLGVHLKHNQKDGSIILTQYHDVVYDDQFSTIPNAKSRGVFQDCLFDATAWDTVGHSGLELNLDPDLPFCSPLHDDWLTTDEHHHHSHQRELCQVHCLQDSVRPYQPPSSLQREIHWMKTMSLLQFQREHFQWMMIKMICLLLMLGDLPPVDEVPDLPLPLALDPPPPPPITTTRLG